MSVRGGAAREMGRRRAARRDHRGSGGARHQLRRTRRPRQISPTPIRSTCSAMSPSTRRSARAASGPQRFAKSRRTFSTNIHAKARQVLNELLEKYAEYGTAQFVIPDILKVPPISDRGSVMEISQMFGGADKLRSAVNELQALLLRSLDRKLCPNKKPAKKDTPAIHRPAARLRLSNPPRHHAQGQGAQWRPRPPADAHLDHVPEVPRRHGEHPSARKPSSPAKDSAPPSSRPTAGAIGPPNPQGITGDELLAFINQDEAMRPDGKRGAGLFAYLRSLRSANGDRRDVIATVFKGRSTA